MGRLGTSDVGGGAVRAEDDARGSGYGTADGGYGRLW